MAVLTTTPTAKNQPTTTATITTTTTSTTTTSTTKPKIKPQQGHTIIQWNKGNAPFLNRIDDLKVIIEDFQPHILAISEANLHKNAHLPSLKIQGYSAEIDNLSSHNLRTQVVVYINNSLSYKRRSDLEIAKCAMVWLEITPPKGLNYLLNIGYREWNCQVSPNNEGRTILKQNERLSEMVNSWEKASNENKMITIIGDWNVDLLTPNTDRKTLFITLQSAIINNNLDLLTLETTRKQGKNRNSALDLIITNKKEQINNISYHPSRSDHLMVKCTILTKVAKVQQSVRIARTFALYSQQKFLTLANCINTDDILQSEDPDYVATKLTGHITSILDKLAPEKKMVNRIQHAPHLTSATKLLMKQRNVLKDKSNETQTPEARTEYCKARNKVVREIRKDKKEWLAEQSKGEPSNSKEVWKLVNTISGKKSHSNIIELNHNNKSSTTKLEIATTLNNFFEEKIVKLKASLQPPKQPYVKKL